MTLRKRWIHATTKENQKQNQNLKRKRNKTINQPKTKVKQKVVQGREIENIIDMHYKQQGKNKQNI